MNKETKFFKYIENQNKALIELKNRGLSEITENDVWSILKSEFGLDDTTYSELIIKNLSTEEIVEIIERKIVENGGKPLLIIDIDCLSSDIEIEINSDNLSKAIVNIDNVRWFIYKNDKDPFPSSPHAHDNERNLKLCLRSGHLFHKRAYRGKIKPKLLIQIREEIERKMPSLKLPLLEKK